MREIEVDRGGRVLRARDAGALSGRAQLVMPDGEGHLGLFEHLGEILAELTRPGAALG
jgi:hypothetical protein